VVFLFSVSLEGGLAEVRYASSGERVQHEVPAGTKDLLRAARDVRQTVKAGLICSTGHYGDWVATDRSHMIAALRVHLN